MGNEKKASGVHRARVNARGFEQQEGIHFDKDSIASPVVNDMTIRIVLTIMLLASWFAYMIDHVGAFLHGSFEPGEQLYIKVPKGMEKHYPEGTVLLLLRTLYGLKQSAAQYWKETVQCFEDMGYKRSKADPCLYFKWTVMGLMLWMSWVDDLLSVGKKETVLQEKEEMKKRFDCDDVGEANEYVGCKVERIDGKIRLTQPVLLQSFKDEFELPIEKYTTPAAPGSVLMAGNEEDHIDIKQQ